MPKLDILYEDNHLLVLNKPPGVATMGAAAAEPSLHAWACDFLRKKYNKPGRVYLGVVSRLDKFTTGVLPFARTSKAARRLNEQMKEGSIEKRYLAVVQGQPPESGQCEDWLIKDDAAHRMRVARPGTGSLARLSWRTVCRSDHQSIVEVLLETGRKHQIRVQFAQLGYPIVGDTKYGERQNAATTFGLHCRSVSLAHPTLKQMLTFDAPVPTAWQQLGFSARQLGDLP